MIVQRVKMRYKVSLGNSLYKLLLVVNEENRSNGSTTQNDTDMTWVDVEMITTLVSCPLARVNGLRLLVYRLQQAATFDT